MSVAHQDALLPDSLARRAGRVFYRLGMAFLRVVVAVWAVMVGILYFAQDAMIYPAPQAALPDPSMSLDGRVFSMQTLTTPDGLLLHFWAAAPAPGKPVILFFHGNGSAANQVAPYAGRLTHEGYGVVLAEYRGYSGNPGSPSESGLATDARAYADWAQRQYGSGLPIVMGESLGTGVAVGLASERPVRGLVLDSAFTSVDDVVRAGPYFWVPTFLLRTHFRNIERIRHVTAPVAFLHGGGDTMMPRGFTDRLEHAAPCPRADLERPNGIHLVFGSDATGQSYGFVSAFLASLQADGACPSVKAGGSHASKT